MVLKCFLRDGRFEFSYLLFHKRMSYRVFFRGFVIQLHKVDVVHLVLDTVASQKRVFGVKLVT